MMAAHQWLTTVELGSRYRWSQDTVRRMCESGSFPNAVRSHVGGQWRIPEGDVAAFVQSTRPIRRPR